MKVLFGMIHMHFVHVLALVAYMGSAFCGHCFAWVPALAGSGGGVHRAQAAHRSSYNSGNSGSSGSSSGGSRTIASSSPCFHRATANDRATLRRTASGSSSEEISSQQGEAGSSDLPVVAKSSEREQQQQQQQKQPEPWWEEERRTKGLPTLTAATQWRMFLSLKDPALGGEKGETTEVTVRVKFCEDKNFEPPQGSLEIIEDNPCFTQQAGKARWTLSEAEDERGAGLWVWGLFKDPLYPFLLLQMDNLGIDLRGGGKIEPGRLYVKIDHRRDNELGPTLKSGTVGVKLIERVRVDPLGMAEADIASVVPCGSVRFRAV